ncbi:hypothetical protein P8452_25983 [Trifolium repens]|nr:hypothetical protein P8452_25983 [Trifolium repens]
MSYTKSQCGSTLHMAWVNTRVGSAAIFHYGAPLEWLELRWYKKFKLQATNQRPRQGVTLVSFCTSTSTTAAPKVYMQDFIESLLDKVV